MRTKIVLRYYCDHCSKGGFRKQAMIEHELVCIKNPLRAHCWMCAQVPQQTPTMRELTAALNEGNGLEKLRDVAQGCPACILAAIVQDRTVFDEEDRRWIEFDYKTEKQAFLNSLTPAHEIMGF